MSKFWKTLNLIILIFLLVLCTLGTFYKHITFGLGLGDIFGYSILYISTIIHLILTFLLRKKTYKWFVLLSLFFGIITVLICLKATIWRGNLYKWNGDLFYIPCREEIIVKKGNKTKSIVVEICSGNFETNLNGKWNGKTLEIKNEKINVPKKLNKYINNPIKYVAIQSYISDDSTIQPYEIKTDTLKTNQFYRFYGIITRIENGIPIFKVRKQ